MTYILGAWALVAVIAAAAVWREIKSAPTIENNEDWNE